MQFSIARLMLVVLFVNFVVAASFGLPHYIGFPLLTFVALFAVPPFIIVGAVNTRGRRQAFFLGAIVAGVPHFFITAYFATVIVITYSDWISDLSEIPRHIHAVGFLVGAIGGFFGMASHWFLTRDETKSSVLPASKQGSQQKEATTPPEIYREDEIRSENEFAQNEKTVLPK